jgi:actin-related protein
VDIVIAGGTSSPTGFETLVENVVKKSKLPINIGRIIKPKDPLYSVAKGCLIAAEAADMG